MNYRAELDGRIAQWRAQQIILRRLREALDRYHDDQDVCSSGCAKRLQSDNERAQEVRL